MAADSLIEASLFLSELVSHEDQLYGSNVANFRPLSSATANSDLDILQPCNQSVHSRSSGGPDALDSWDVHGSPGEQDWLPDSSYTGETTLPSDLFGDPSVRLQPTSSSSGDIRAGKQARRKAQNRSAQRAFRERKDKYIKDLETKIKTLSSSVATLNTTNATLRRERERFRCENGVLAAVAFSKVRLDDKPPSALLDHVSKDRLEESSKRFLRHAIGPWNTYLSDTIGLSGQVDVGDFCGQVVKFALHQADGLSIQRCDILRIVAKIGSCNEEIDKATAFT